jgi:hypothetical protein
MMPPLKLPTNLKYHFFFTPNVRSTSNVNNTSFSTCGYLIPLLTKYVSISLGASSMQPSNVFHKGRNTMFEGANGASSFGTSKDDLSPSLDHDVILSPKKV